MKKIHRWTLEVDSEIHEIFCPPLGPILRVEAPHPEVVEFWAEVDTNKPNRSHRFIVVGTGQPFDGDWYAVGTTSRVADLVWHLLIERHYDRVESA